MEHSRRHGALDPRYRAGPRQVEVPSEPTLLSLHTTSYDRSTLTWEDEGGAALVVAGAPAQNA